ncbi:MAG: hypothetical protein HY717_18350 [Planctomycetes bacterium]|nr:hypothetical protein [Planctomycetota bacterium]
MSLSPLKEHLFSNFGICPRSCRWIRLWIRLWICLAGAGAVMAGEKPSGVYRSPFDVVFSPDGGLVLASDRTAGKVVFIDARAAHPPIREVALEGEPAGLALSGDGRRLFAAEYGSGTVAEIDLASGEVVRRLKVGRQPSGLAVVPQKKLLLVANTIRHDVSIVDLETGAETARVAVPREPFFLAVAPDGSMAVAGNLLPAGSARSPEHAAAISLIALSGRSFSVHNVLLPPGSTSVRAVKVSPDGRWAYAAHTVGRVNVPTSQLERGWVSTNALSIIDLQERKLYATALLDSLERGAADPWGLALSRDGRKLWITLRGVHELAVLDLGELHRLMAGEGSGAVTSGAKRAAETAALREQIRQEPSARLRLVDDLQALGQAGVLRRLPVPGKGPRGAALSPDGKLLAVACYHSGEVAFFDAESEVYLRSTPLGPQPPADLARRGEILFHDATIAFQHWLSCSTCHPDNGRNDGLHWDLLNDGLGTPQKTRSLLLSYLVAPTTARGVRPDFQSSVEAGFRFLHTEPAPERVQAAMAYLKSLAPEPSPFLGPDGELGEAARRGQAIFEGKGKCARCHNGPIRTDLKPHDIGSAGEDEVGGTQFYTAKLLELFRTAPYLHDGRAKDLRSLFKEHNPEGRHGEADRLSEDELNDLIEYLLTL